MKIDPVPMGFEEIGRINRQNQSPVSEEDNTLLTIALIFCVSFSVLTLLKISEQRALLQKYATQKTRKNMFFK